MGVVVFVEWRFIAALFRNVGCELYRLWKLAWKLKVGAWRDVRCGEVV